MKKFVYAVAGVLALSPVIALASVSTPASAAVQHPAAAEATCADEIQPSNFFDSNAYGGYLWADGTATGSEVYSYADAADAGSDYTWCVVGGQAGYSLLRLQGTSDECLEWDATDGLAHLADCDSSKVAQNWANNGTEVGNEQEGAGECLTSNKGTEQPLLFAICTGDGGQDWLDFDL